MRQKYIATAAYEQHFWRILFDDVRVVDFKTTDFQRLDEVFKDEYGSRDYYFFDEIQNADKWEVFVRIGCRTSQREE